IVESPKPIRDRRSTCRAFPDRTRLRYQRGASALTRGERSIGEAILNDEPTVIFPNAHRCQEVRCQSLRFGEGREGKWSLGVARCRRSEISERHIDRSRDLLGRATGGVTFEKRAAVVANTNRKAALVLVIVGGAEGQPAPARALDPLEALEDRRAREHQLDSTMSVLPSALDVQRMARRWRSHSRHGQGTGSPASRRWLACSTSSRTARVAGGMSSRTASVPSARATYFMPREIRARTGARSSPRSWPVRISIRALRGHRRPSP